MSPTSQSASALLVRDALLAQAVQASVDAVFCQDVDGVVLTWNPAAELLYGYRVDDILGRPAQLLVPERTREDLHRVHRAAVAGERIERFDTWHQHRDGMLLPVSVTAAPLRDDDGTVVAVVKTVSDISERLRLQTDVANARVLTERQNMALTRSNRGLEQFAYVASHDLSEPLRVMSGYAQQLERRYDDVLDERGRRYMAHIIDASTRMRALIDDLLDFSRFVGAPPVRVRVDTAAVLERVLAMLDGPLQEAPTEVEVVPPLPPVLFDPTHLESLLSNLVSNAVKFRSPDRPARLRIAATEHEGHVTLTVDDSGIGIEPAYRDRVFRMFQRLHAREDYPGTGIGLAIAQQIVEVHDGRIWVEDSPLGGTRFCCTLPAAQPDEG